MVFTMGSHDPPERARHPSGRKSIFQARSCSMRSLVYLGEDNVSRSKNVDAPGVRFVDFIARLREVDLDEVGSPRRPPRDNLRAVQADLGEALRDDDFRLDCIALEMERLSTPARLSRAF